MKKDSSKHYTDGIATLLVFVIFASFIILTLMAGAGIYKRISERNNHSYEMRTVTQYITTRIRHAESPNDVGVGKIGDISALQITEEIAGDDYITYIYGYDGYLREVYVQKDTDVKPQTGEKLIRIEDVSFDMTDGLVSVDIMLEDGTEKSFGINVRGSEGIL